MRRMILMLGGRRAGFIPRVVGVSGSAAEYRELAAG